MANYEKILKAWQGMSAVEFDDVMTKNFHLDDNCIEQEDIVFMATGYDKWDNVYEPRFTLEAVNNGTFDSKTQILSVSDTDGWDYELEPIFKK